MRRQSSFPFIRAGAGNARLERWETAAPPGAAVRDAPSASAAEDAAASEISAFSLLPFNGSFILESLS